MTAATEDLLAYTARRLRNRLRDMADGSAACTAYLDDDGLGGEPVPITARVTVEGERLVIDFAGSGPQSRGGYNMPESAMRACVAYCAKAMLDPEIVANEGLFAAIELRAPEGTITRPRFPAAVGMPAIICCGPGPCTIVVVYGTGLVVTAICRERL